MRIARFEIDGGLVFGSERDGQFLRCEGDLFGGLNETGDRVPIGAKLLAPISPPTIFAIGLNYRAHALEMKKPIPDHPVVTMKNPSAVLEPGGTIEIPTFLASDSVDYECELVIVMGRRCKNATPENAMDYVLGFTAANDVSARDWQQIYSGGQWCKGKSFDTFCPLGPVLVTTDELGNPDSLRISTFLNGLEVQSSSTSDMIFSVRDLVCFLSGSTTLEPGTVILTGTPPGVGIAQTPPRFLRPGDEVAVEIEGIGRLVNRVANEESIV
ncbi:MAG: fumarylacetoacetate hydrolase family protein [Puniceicoccaceae bacterium]